MTTQEAKKPLSRYLIERLRERPEAERIVLMRQVELLKSGTRTSMHPAGVGQTGALELLMKLGSFLNGVGP